MPPPPLDEPLPARLPPSCLRAPPASPARTPSAQTLYVSKNGLRSLEGVQQFSELRALSAADNEIADLDELRAIPAAGIALEAASFVRRSAALGGGMRGCLQQRGPAGCAMALRTMRLCPKQRVN